MRAMVVRVTGGPEALIAEDVPEPESRHNKVRIRVRGSVRLASMMLSLATVPYVGRSDVGDPRARNLWTTVGPGSPGKTDALRTTCADHVVLATYGSDFSAEVPALTDGEDVGVAIDNVGSDIFEPARHPGGQLSSAFLRFNPAQLFLRGSVQLEDALVLVARGRTGPVIAARPPLAAAPEAHPMVERAGPTGPILLCPGLS
jgi:acryloyl-coenzyme A reductase